jgi:hypothetical protein
MGEQKSAGNQKPPVPIERVLTFLENVKVLAEQAKKEASS